MGTTYLKSIKVVITFKDGNTESIPFIVPIQDIPFYEVRITWDDNIRINSGEVIDIVIHDGKDKYRCNSNKKIYLEDGQDLVLEFPNKIFHLTTKKTNVIGITFCIDELPENWEKVIPWLFKDSELHHPKILFRKDGYYREEF